MLPLYQVEVRRICLSIKNCLNIYVVADSPFKCLHWTTLKLNHKGGRRHIIGNYFKEI